MSKIPLNPDHMKSILIIQSGNLFYNHGLPWNPGYVISDFFSCVYIPISGITSILTMSRNIIIITAVQGFESRSLNVLGKLPSMNNTPSLSNELNKKKKNNSEHWSALT